MPANDHQPPLNHVLRSLPPADYERLRPLLNEFKLSLGEVIQEAHTPIRHVYFIESGLVSLQIPIDDGHIVEVTLAGFEGLVGLPLLVGTTGSFFRAIAQTPGTALRINSDALQQFAPTSLSFQQACLRYADLQIAHTAQVAACNALHQLEQRLARWLLMAEDRTGLESLPFTHEFLSHMLATNRATVSLAAEALKRGGMINYTRGNIAIRNRRALEQAACECYPILRDQLLHYQRRSPNVTAK